MRVGAIFLACLIHGLLLLGLITLVNIPVVTENSTISVTWLPPMETQNNTLDSSGSSSIGHDSIKENEELTQDNSDNAHNNKPDTLTKAEKNSESEQDKERDTTEIDLPKEPELITLSGEQPNTIPIQKKKATIQQPKKNARVSDSKKKTGEKSSSPAPNRSAGAQVAEFSQNNGMIAIVSNVEKCYPKLSQKRGEEGVATVVVVVGPKNNVINVKISKSTGYQRLDDCALTAVKKAQFKSAMKDGAPITSTITLPPIRFTIKR